MKAGAEGLAPLPGTIFSPAILCADEKGKKKEGADVVPPPHGLTQPSRDAGMGRGDIPLHLAVSHALANRPELPGQPPPLSGGAPKDPPRTLRPRAPPCPAPGEGRAGQDGAP